MSLRVLFAAALALAPLACAQAPMAEQWELAPVLSRPHGIAPDIAPGAVMGDLVYRGGVELAAPDVPRFGGFSGVAVSPTGELTAVSDAGAWMRAALVLDPATDALVGVRDVRLAAMRDEAGQPFRSKRDGDAEDLSLLPDGRYAVSFEQRHRILIYDLDKDGPFASAVPGPAVLGTEGMHPNEGLEGLAAMADGGFVAAAEYAPKGPGGPFWTFAPGAAEASIAGLAPRPRGFGLVGLTRAPNGDVIALERFLLPLVGVRITVRRIDPAGLRASPARFDGPVLAALEPPLRLDNFEAIAAVPGKDGAIRIYLLSDDNFSDNQKTLLYAFDWTPPAAVAEAVTQAPPPPAVAAPPVVAAPVAPPAAPPPAKSVAVLEAEAKAELAARAAARAEEAGPRPQQQRRVAQAPPPKPKPKPPEPKPEPVAPAPEPAPAAPPPPAPRPMQGPEL